MTHFKLQLRPSYIRHSCNYYFSGLNFSTSSECKLEVQDFRRLRGDGRDKWVTIDYFFAIIVLYKIQEKHITSLTIRTDTGTSAIIEGEIVGDSGFVSEAVVTTTTTKMFFPLHINDSHFVLAYPNLAKQEFSYIDPAHDKKDAKQVNLYVANLNKFIDSHPQWSNKIMNRTWKVKAYQHPKQNFAVDANNCGVFVI